MDLSALRSEFVKETEPLVAEVEATLLALERALEREGAAGDLWRRLLLPLHTVKGNSGIIGFKAAQTLAHRMEDCAKGAPSKAVAEQLATARALLSASDALRDAIRAPDDSSAKLEEAARALDGEARGASTGAPTPKVSTAAPSPTAASTSMYASYAVQRVADVRIGAEKLDRLLELVGELATHHSRVADVVRAFSDRVASSDAEATAASDAVDQLGKTIAEVRDGVTEARLLPLNAALQRFRRLVRDLCLATGKRASFEVVGAETVVDKRIVDAIGEPLLHVLRNAVDHGLETPEQRQAAGKPAEARVALTIERRGRELFFVVRDDGRGIDRAKLAARARERGIRCDEWSDAELLELIFVPDISTADRVTELSGRGVGLDAARKAVERVGGAIDVTSEPGRGTELAIRVPLTLTLQPVLLLQRGGEVYAVGLASVVATSRVKRDDVHAIDGRTFLRFRSKLLPIYDLGALLAVPGLDHGPGPALCVVLEDAGRSYGLLVESVIGQQDVVLTELDPTLGRPVGIAGATLLADGRAAMVLDARVHERGRA